MLWSEALSICNGRIVTFRLFQPPFYPLPIRVLGHYYMTVPVRAHTIWHVLQAVSSPPHLGGAIDHNSLRRCILTGTDLLAYAERCRMNSSDAGVDIDKTSIQAASVVLHISLPATLDSLICSQVRHSGRSCTIFHALPQWIISLHVFEDDTVAKVTVSKANLNVFFVLLGPAPFFVASLFCFEAKRKSGWGICGSFLVVVVLLFFVCRWFRDDLPKFLDHTCPCTFLLFTAYAIVRTEPSANRPNRRKKIRQLDEEEECFWN